MQADSFTRRYSVRNLSRSPDRLERMKSAPDRPWVPTDPSSQVGATPLLPLAGSSRLLVVTNICSERLPRKINAH